MTDQTELAGRLRSVLRAADGAALAGLLAEEVEWLGSRGGACHGPGEVLAVVLPLLAGDGNVEVLDVRVKGSGLLVEIDLTSDRSAEPQRWTGIVLADGSGQIVRIQEYESVAGAGRDLEALAGAPVGRGRDGDRATARGTAVVDLVPFIHVADVATSVAFYRRLGLAVRETHGPDGRLVWASLGSERAELMLAVADKPVDAGDQGVLFYLYAHDLAGLRDHLLASGILPSEILDGSPGPRHEMRVSDPDGYCLMVAQIEGEPMEDRPGEPR